MPPLCLACPPLPPRTARCTGGHSASQAWPRERRLRPSRMGRLQARPPGQRQLQACRREAWGSVRIIHSQCAHGVWGVERGGGASTARHAPAWCDSIQATPKRSISPKRLPQSRQRTSWPDLNGGRQHPSFVAGPARPLPAPGSLPPPPQPPPHPHPSHPSARGPGVPPSRSAGTPWWGPWS